MNQGVAVLCFVALVIGLFSWMEEGSLRCKYEPENFMWYQWAFWGIKGLIIVAALYLSPHLA